jgi:hypothetical protein
MPAIVADISCKDFSIVRRGWWLGGGFVFTSRFVRKVEVDARNFEIQELATSEDSILNTTAAIHIFELLEFQFIHPRKLKPHLLLPRPRISKRTLNEHFIPIEYISLSLQAMSQGEADQTVDMRDPIPQRKYLSRLATVYKS